MLLQIDTGYACAGVEVNSNGMIYNAAPIFAWMIGKPFNEIRKWKRIKSIKGWAGKKGEIMISKLSWSNVDWNAVHKGEISPIKVLQAVKMNEKDIIDKINEIIDEIEK